jgi:hypothetical protein
MAMNEEKQNELPEEKQNELPEEKQNELDVVNEYAWRWLCCIYDQVGVSGYVSRGLRHLLESRPTLRDMVFPYLEREELKSNDFWLHPDAPHQEIAPPPEIKEVMTNAQLIAELNKLPGDKPVVIRLNNGVYSLGEPGVADRQVVGVIPLNVEGYGLNVADKATIDGYITDICMVSAAWDDDYEPKPPDWAKDDGERVVRRTK